MAVYFSKRKIKVREDEDLGELNIIPYLDILMNLIIFMLLSMTGLATFGILNVSAPSYGGASANPPGEENKPQLTLTVAVSKKGFYVAATGGVLGGAEPAGAPGGDAAPTIAVKSDGSFDYDALTEKMKEIKGNFPNETKIILAADSEIAYEVIVGTMDATRETKDRKLLFPDITLANF
jgi:biopolymer transport protein TolR